MKMFFKLFFLSFFIFLKSHGTDFIIRDLGTLANDESQGSSINNNNVVVGSFKNTSSEKYDFIWDQSHGMTILPCADKSVSYQRPFINNLNQVAGVYWYETNNWFFENTTRKHLYIYHSDGSFEDIGWPKKWKNKPILEWQTISLWDEKDLAIVDFNDLGQILIANSSDVSKVTEYAIWHQGKYKYIDPAQIDRAYGLNNCGLILGRRWPQNKKGTDVPQLVLYDFERNMHQIITNDVNFFHKDFNDKGQVILVQMLEDQDIVKGFFWDPKQGLIAYQSFIPFAINNLEQMIGMQESKDEKFIPSFWWHGELTDLNQTLQIGSLDCPWENINLPTSLNDNGWIIGLGLFDNKKHGYVLIPTDL